MNKFIQIIKNNIWGFILGGLIFGTMGTYASPINGKSVEYIKKDGTITTVEEAVNELYGSSKTIAEYNSYGTERYNAGVTAADARVNDKSANYQGGYNDGIVFADSRTNTSSSNYKAGYTAGTTSITGSPKTLTLGATNGTAVAVTAGYYNKVNTNAVYNAGVSSITGSPKTLTLGATNGTAVAVTAGYYNKVNTSAVYNAGVTAADARANSSSANYKAGYNAGVTAADGRANASSTNYQSGYNAGVAAADARANGNSYNWKHGYNSASDTARAHLSNVHSSITQNADAAMGASKLATCQAKAKNVYTTYTALYNAIQNMKA